MCKNIEHKDMSIDNNFIEKAAGVLLFKKERI
jgi:hypothetical protein